MKMRSRTSLAGLTLVETIIYAAMGCLVSLIAYSALRSAAVLAVKNTNLNRSHDDLRSAYDRLARHLLAAGSVPTLIDSAGATVSTTYTADSGNSATGPAAGFSFDRNIGGPYVLDPDTTAGTLPSTASSWSFWISNTALSTAPLPLAGEIMVIPTPTGSIRASVLSSSVTGSATGRRRITVNFSAAVGQTLTWGASQPQCARLVKREAFIVIGPQLRYYPAFQPMPVLSNPDTFRLMTDQISTLSGEQTPFSVEAVNGDRILTSRLQVRERQDAQWISNKEANSYNSYFQLHVNLPSRFRPVTTN
jgi:type II secretory pathway component PulJ